MNFLYTRSSRRLVPATVRSGVYLIKAGSCIAGYRGVKECEYVVFAQEVAESGFWRNFRIKASVDFVSGEGVTCLNFENSGVGALFCEELPVSLNFTFF